ncbi:DUF4129 domain-containing protein [Streptomyces sp. LaPpAH-108]|uniref:DUF4129 domain-containing protein n=1 Tax=Streptomyces sp. LaPpAH-108 TaxID=1155714 RepID=UPI000D0AB52F|nr:DUF4129 domain-containing protein [Streptomyces sp. LaPpAH-108]
MRRDHTEDDRRRHGAIGPAQAASAVLVVAGVALAALLLHTDTGLLTKGRGPLGGNPVLVVVLALLTPFGALALRGTYQERVGAGELDPVEERMADGVSRILLAAAPVVPLLVLLLHRFGTSGSDHESGNGPLPTPHPGQDLKSSLPPPAHHAGHADHSTDFGLTRVLLGLVIALLVVVVVIAGLRLWRHLTRPSAPETPATYATLDDERQRLAQAVDSGRRALVDGTDARAAVIACYAAMEQSLADSGVTRRASDSPQDLLERAVTGGLPTGTAAATLTALFREARYSTHPMDDSRRDRAAAALAEIADGLGSRTPRPDVTGTS